MVIGTHSLGSAAEDVTSITLGRREMLASSLAAVAIAMVPGRAGATVPKPYSFDAMPPMDSREAYIAWMQANRGEDPKYLRERWDRLQQMIAHKDIWDVKDKRAYLLTPREEFVRKQDRERAYEWHFLEIGFGVTITGPLTVARMTNSIDVHRGDKVLEIGTGSGYQSAYLSNLTDKVWSIEIIKPLFERTNAIRQALIDRGYSEYKAINHRNADGYDGWPEAAPFDKIIVTCGIDHIPPPLLQQLKPNGVMVIPVGPPGATHILKVTKTQSPDGTTTVARTDIYHGSIIKFVPFTKLQAGVIKGTHSGR